MNRCVLAVSLFLVASCTNIKPVDQQFSGFLDDYSDLQPVDMPDGSKAMRWYAPTARDGEYTKVIVNPIEFYPRPQPSEQVSRQRLVELSNYMTRTLRDELSKDYEIVSDSGLNTFSLRFAITGVETPIEGLKAYNAIPVSMVVAGVSTATGERDHVPVLYIEAQATDSTSGMVLAKGVRQGVGHKLQNDREKLEIEHLKELVMGWSKDVATMARNLKVSP